MVCFPPELPFNSPTKGSLPHECLQIHENFLLFTVLYISCEIYRDISQEQRVRLVFIIEYSTREHGLLLPPCSRPPTGSPGSKCPSLGYSDFNAQQFKILSFQNLLEVKVMETGL